MELFTTQREIDKLDFTETNRAANLCILRKVADVMGKTDLLYNINRGAEKGILDISENTVSRICALNYKPSRWKVDEVAEEELLWYYILRSEKVEEEFKKALIFDVPFGQVN